MLEVSFKIVSILLGIISNSFFNSSKTQVSALSSTSAKYIANKDISVIWDVYALVDATAISGPACV